MQLLWLLGTWTEWFFSATCPQLEILQHKKSPIFSSKSCPHSKCSQLPVTTPAMGNKPMGCQNSSSKGECVLIIGCKFCPKQLLWSECAASNLLVLLNQRGLPAVVFFYYSSIWAASSHTIMDKGAAKSQGNFLVCQMTPDSVWQPSVTPPIIMISLLVHVDPLLVAMAAAPTT